MVSFSNLTFGLRRILFDTREITSNFVNKKELLYTEKCQTENIIFLYDKRNIKTKNVVYHGCKYDPFDINYQDKFGWTALICASLNGKGNMVKIILEFEADPNIQSKNGFTALIRASQYGRENTVKILLEVGADHNIRDKDRFTALDWASKNGHKNIVRMLSNLT